jgi:light-regulated signal transduction histidine kinase (bacteriophytochrome)
VVCQDVTERKRAEEEREQLLLQLKSANEELEAFNHSVAHDLRKPLNLLGSYLQVIDKLCGEGLQDECKGYLRNAYNVTVRMDRLIGALLGFSYMGRVELRRETVDLSALAHEVIATLKQSEPDRQVEARIANGIKADGDASLLRLVLDNLLGNAWKYTGRQSAALIEFATGEMDGKQVYWVRDNGPGFDKADADHLFIPFQRLPGAEKFDGFGVGLATVERIIRRHGGKVWAEGEPDRGATFYFTLS